MINVLDDNKSVKRAEIIVRVEICLQCGEGTFENQRS